MATGLTQISANISAETKERMERFARTHGVKKSHLIETALLHHLRALDEVPTDILIPPILELSRESGERILRLLENPPAPTPAMKALWDD